MTIMGRQCRTVATGDWLGVPFCHRHNPHMEIQAGRDLNSTLWAAIEQKTTTATERPQAEEAK